MASSYTAPYPADADRGRHNPSKIISADKVHDTDVYNNADEKLGNIDSILIDKHSGEVAYVVMSFGGFLGIGEKFHPLPWRVLDYDTNIGGYRVDLNREELNDAPAYDRDTISAYDYDADSDGLNDYYASKFRRPARDGFNAGDTRASADASLGDTGIDSRNYDRGTLAR